MTFFCVFFWSHEQPFASNPHPSRLNLWMGFGAMVSSQLLILDDVLNATLGEFSKFEVACEQLAGKLWKKLPLQFLFDARNPQTTNPLHRTSLQPRCLPATPTMKLYRIVHLTLQKVLPEASAKWYMYHILWLATPGYGQGGKKQPLNMLNILNRWKQFETKRIT